MTKRIFEATTLGNIHLKNRLFRSATHEAFADDFGHFPQEYYDMYDTLAKGGVGCIIVSVTSVSDNDMALSGLSRLCNDELIVEHKKLVDIIHKSDIPVLVQLSLGDYNRQTDPVTQKVSIDDLTHDDIQYIESLFEAAALRAKKSGYDGIELHAGHFYFLSRFISPLFNHRTDHYGGPPENRARILLEIITRVKKAAPDLLLAMKINCQDFREGGLTEDDFVSICKLCEGAGLQAVEVSGGTVFPVGAKNHSYYRHSAVRLAKEVKMPVIEVGGNKSLTHMQEILNEGVSYLSLARPLIREPNLPKRWLEGDTSDAKCVSCNMCRQLRKGRCIFVEKEKEKEREKETKREQQDAPSP